MEQTSAQRTKNQDTRNKILDAATRLFALKGFKAVRLKDIAKEVGTKIASLYYYYDTKDAIIDAVLQRFEAAHKKYNTWLRKANAKVETVDELINNLLNEDFLMGLDTVSRLGISLIMKEQHSSDAAYRAIRDHIFTEDVETIQDGFDRLVAKGVITPCDTHTIATLIMFCITSVNNIHIHEVIGQEMPVDKAKVYDGLRRIITVGTTLK